MRLLIATAAVALVAGLATAANAQDRNDEPSCRAGIAFIEAEQAKNPTPAVAEELRRSLVNARRELAEGEYDECMDAVRRARRAVGV